MTQNAINIHVLIIYNFSAKNDFYIHILHKHPFGCMKSLNKLNKTDCFLNLINIKNTNINDNNKYEEHNTKHYLQHCVKTITINILE